MSARTLLLTADDRIVRDVFARHLVQAVDRAVLLARDASPGLKRVLRLLLRGRLPWGTAFRMAWADARRPAGAPIPFALDVESNAALIQILRAEGIGRILLFRAGLIVSKAVLDAGVPVLNVHCARIPGYGGLGSIQRALLDGALDQEAVLHRVTRAIDEGEVLDGEPYRLDASASYRRNEDVAYDAGGRLLARTLRRGAAGEAVS